MEIHHLVHRAHGGGHEASNVILCCSSCHLAHHRGLLTITGTADQVDVRRTRDAGLPVRAHVGANGNEPRSSANVPPSRFARVSLRNDAKAALTGAGWTPAIATAAVAAAGAALGADATLEQLIREALRQCPRRDT